MIYGIPEFMIFMINFIGALFIPFVSRIGEKVRSWYAVVIAGISAVLAFLSFLVGTGETEFWTWIPELGINFGVMRDSLSVVITLLVSVLGLFIVLYSVEYMEHGGDRGDLDRYYFLMLLFIGGMQLLVMSDSLLSAFIGWEVMGICSYALIGFWKEGKGLKDEQYNTASGTKAFIVTRIGDAFLLSGLMLLYFLAGTLSLTELSANHGQLVTEIAHSVLLLPALIFMFIGAIGKSAQVPLQIWLPEAMAGPATVSSIIHGAAMVKAGIYLSSRLFLVFRNVEVETLFLVIAIIGGITAFVTGTMGTAARELKQVLAFSTCSQLAYMLMGLGTAGLLAHHYDLAYFSSIYHWINHAVFKALLFLSAGAVLHAAGDDPYHGRYVKDLFDLGGMRKQLPKTFAVMAIGALALSGVPPFSGFWSKDSIIEYTWELGSEEPIGLLLFGLAVATAALTIFYSLRIIGLTFFGPKSENLKRHEAAGGHVADPGLPMMVPLFCLAVFSLVAWGIGPDLSRFLVGEEGVSFGKMIESKLSPPSLITLGALVVGGVPSYFLYIRQSINRVSLVEGNIVLRAIHRFFENRWYINALYLKLLAGFLWFCRKLFKKFDLAVLEGVNVGVAEVVRRGSIGVRWADEHVVDGFADGIKDSGVFVSEEIKPFQTGRISDYAFVFLFGLAMLILTLLVSQGVI
ncbi:MAG: NADH-quinone oxidoreductase subunit L [Candidatus Heimdallarchaeota archaeon]